MAFKQAKPFIAAVFLQIGFSGLAVIAKSALNKGMNHFTFSVYRNLVAAAVISPFALLLERRVRPAMTKSIFFKILLLGLLEPVIDQNFYYEGMKNTSATFSAAMTNILPAITFSMACIVRLEYVNIRRLHSQMKILGTVVTVGGAMIMTLVMGPSITLPWSKVESIHHVPADSTFPENQVKGSLFIIAGCFCWACFYIVQAITLRSYPAELSLTALICLAGAVQGTIVTLIIEKGNSEIWLLNWDSKLFAALYGGVICSGMAYYVSGVLMKKKGPVFLTAFNPLSMIIVAIIGSIFLHERLNFGRVSGAMTIIIGLYLVIWGKTGDKVAPADPQVNKTDLNGKQDVDTLSITMTTEEAGKSLDKNIS